MKWFKELNLMLLILVTIVILKRLRNKKLEPHVFGPYEILEILDDKKDFVKIKNIKTKHKTTSSISNLFPINL